MTSSWQRSLLLATGFVLMSSVGVAAPCSGNNVHCATIHNDIANAAYQMMISYQITMTNEEGISQKSGGTEKGCFPINTVFDLSTHKIHDKMMAFFGEEPKAYLSSWRVDAIRCLNTECTRATAITGYHFEINRLSDGRYQSQPATMEINTTLGKEGTCPTPLSPQMPEPVKK